MMNSSISHGVIHENAATSSFFGYSREDSQISDGVLESPKRDIFGTQFNVSVEPTPCIVRKKLPLRRKDRSLEGFLSSTVMTQEGKVEAITKIAKALQARGKPVRPSTCQRPFRVQSHNRRGSERNNTDSPEVVNLNPKLVEEKPTPRKRKHKIKSSPTRRLPGKSRNGEVSLGNISQTTTLETTDSKADTKTAFNVQDGFSLRAQWFTEPDPILESTLSTTVIGGVPTSEIRNVRTRDRDRDRFTSKNLNKTTFVSSDDLQRSKLLKLRKYLGFDETQNIAPDELFLEGATRRENKSTTTNQVTTSSKSPLRPFTSEILKRKPPRERSDIKRGSTSRKSPETVWKAKTTTKVVHL